jgi:hypothetical protein
VSVFDAMFNAAATPALETVFGVDVQFIRGTNTTESFRATWRSVEYELMDDQGFTAKVAYRIFTLPAESVVVNGARVEPRDGDRVRLLDDCGNGDSGEFELLPAGKLPSFERVAGSNRWRVRTKKVV